MSSISAAKCCRITRSAVTNDAEIIGREMKQEKNIPKIKRNKWKKKPQRKLCETVTVSAVADDEECLFDLSKVKAEPVEETNEPLEEILDTIVTVDLNIVKNEPENDVRYPYVLLDDCVNRKIKLEPKSLEDVSCSDTTFNLNTVKKEQENKMLCAYVLLEDCSLNHKIKLEPELSEEIQDSTAGLALRAVKSENIETPSLLKEIADCNIKTEPTRRSKRNHVKVAYEEEEDDSTKKRSLRSAAAPLIKCERFDGRNAKWEPPNWIEVMDNMRKMRKERNAPIDTMGPHRWMNQGESPKVSRYQTFISLLLSSKTRDEANHKAMTQLRKHGLTINQILETDEETMGKLVAPVTFWRTKARQVLRSTELLRQQHGDDIPKTVAGLVSLPGVGPKMAHICLSLVWGKTTGIGVGSFVHRVANRLGWAQAWEPERTRLMLESWLPRSYWPEINELLVGFGQQTCRARDPQCDRCLIAAKVMCPSAPFNLYYDMD